MASYAADFERSTPHYVGLAGSPPFGIIFDFTWEANWKPESLDESALYYFYDSLHTSGGNPLRIWVEDDTVFKLKLHMQEVAGAAPAADEHVTVEWSLSGLLSVGNYIHLAIAVDISQPVATIAEAVVNGVSQGNGTVISGTDCSLIFLPDNGIRIGADMAGANAVDGPVFDYRIWNGLVRTATQINTDRGHTIADSWGDNVTLNLWKGGSHHISAGPVPLSPDWSGANEPPFIADIPAGMQTEYGVDDARIHSNGPSLYGLVPTDVADTTRLARIDANGPSVSEVTQTEVADTSVPAEFIAYENVAAAGDGIVHRMRAIDTGLGQVVFWNAPVIDPTGLFYGGPGPLTDVVDSEKNCD